MHLASLKTSTRRGILAAVLGATSLAFGLGAWAAPTQGAVIADGETDPAVWGEVYPLEYQRFLLMKDDTKPTPYGGSRQYDKLAVYPAMKRLWNGYAFALDFNEDRSHYYSLIDQKATKRQVVVQQPGACANCHSSDAPALIKSMGWENFNHTPYAQISDKLHSGISCNDCHDPATMKLRITRPALANALAARGIDWTKASEQEMKNYVCAQCHVEYYFKGENKVLTFPWDKGMRIDDIDAYYDEIGFKDWVHKETGAPMIKIQHPETELYSTSVHAKAGVTCVDCHMPVIKVEGQKITEHWVRSPLVDMGNSCGSCHMSDENDLRNRVLDIQDTTAAQLRKAETAIIAAIDDIAAARAAGASDAELAESRNFQRKASMRWDFISSENSMGFHSPEEALRVVGDAVDLARLAQVSADRLLAKYGKTPPSALLLLDEKAVIGAPPPVTRASFMAGYQ